MKRIIALDPGTTETGLVVFDGRRVEMAHILPNRAVLLTLLAYNGGRVDDETVLATEVFQAMGMPVGQEVFETAIWIGRFIQAWHSPDAVCRVRRTEVKLQLCGSSRAKDPNVRQALLDLVGPVGTKSKPGPCYGVRLHCWSALGVAVTAIGKLGPKWRGRLPQTGIEGACDINREATV